MVINNESIENHIPYYLTREQKQGLVAALKDFSRSENVNYYINRYQNEMLQGDGWSELEIVRFENGDRKRIKGIVLSNTCDISPENARDLPRKIIFAPIIKLRNYEERLRTNNSFTDDIIENKIKTIKDQKVTTIFYLPPGGALEEEYIALLDDIHTISAHTYEQLQNKEKLFTLSMIGFYLFLFKLSVHFCRFHEDVSR